MQSSNKIQISNLEIFFIDDDGFARGHILNKNISDLEISIPFDKTNIDFNIGDHLLVELEFVGKKQYKFKKMQRNNKINKQPLVSIIIYNYNYGRFLKDAIESALNQTYKNIEILFSDNSSTDDSWEIANFYSKKFPDKFCLFKNKVNQGTDSNLNNCWINRKGKYFVVLCSDDVLEHNFKI